MSLRRSERRKVSSLEPLSGSEQPTLITSQATAIRKRKVQPALKDRARTLLANAAPPDQSSKPPKSSTKKRKLQDFQDKNPPKSPVATPQDLHSTQSSAGIRPKSKGKPNDDGTTKKTEEKRLRRHREKAPQSFLEKLHRAQTQRMIVIGRTRTDTEAFPREEIDIVGSTGNIYKVKIGQIPSCTCPDHQKGNECKHKVYALHTVLKAPETLVYQLAYLTSELREIFNGAPPIPTSTSSSTNTDGNRKPIEGECPICYQDYEPESNELVWCKAACGQNMHKSCFEQWMAAQKGVTVRCVFCRTPWEVDHGDVRSLTQTASVNAEGYVNVASQFGMSGTRDYSAYNRFSRRAMGLGWGRWHED